MFTLEQWAQALIAKGNFNPAEPVVVGLVAWAVAEGYQPGAATLVNAVWNPLDTTEPWAGATDFNDVHVKNYATLDDGVAATLATLVNGYYPNVLAELRTAEPDPHALARAVGSTPWGTGDFSAVVDRVTADPAGYLALGVAGSETWTGPTPPSTEEDDLPLNADDLTAITTIVDEQIAHAASEPDGPIAKLMSDFYNNQYGPRFDKLEAQLAALQPQAPA